MLQVPGDPGLNGLVGLLMCLGHDALAQLFAPLRALLAKLMRLLAHLLGPVCVRLALNPRRWSARR